MAWKKGESGNPNGRPEGARDRLKNNFLTALADDFREHGVAAIQAVREQTPAAYIKAIVALMPKEFKVATDNPFEQLTDEQLTALIALADGISGKGREGTTGSPSSPQEPSKLH